VRANRDRPRLRRRNYRRRRRLVWCIRHIRRSCIASCSAGTERDDASSYQQRQPAPRLQFAEAFGGTPHGHAKQAHQEHRRKLKLCGLHARRLHPGLNTEVHRLHDLGRDPGVRDFEAFRKRSEENLRYRALHHHVFDTSLAIDLVADAGLRVLAAEAVLPFHIIVIAQKADPASAQVDDIKRDAQARSPFPSDKVLAPS
jgi:hypothetical protein